MSINMQAEKTPMPTQAPDVRNHNFKEVALGYTEEQAINEAKRCLQCKKPLGVTGCPVGIPIPSSLPKSLKAISAVPLTSSLRLTPCPASRAASALRKHSAKANASAASRMNRLPSVAWNVSVADWAAEHAADIICVDPQNGHKAAVIGSGPAGLTCAGELARKGFDVTVFEAFHVAGGVLSYGIPEFRLPKSIVASQVEKLEGTGRQI